MRFWVYILLLVNSEVYPLVSNGHSQGFTGLMIYLLGGFFGIRCQV